MKVAIIGTNGFLGTTIAKHANKVGWALDMYGLDEPVQHIYENFYRTDLMRGDVDVAELIKADIIVYAVGAGIQSNLKESADLVYALNVSAPIRICNALKQCDYKGIFMTFGSYFELGEIVTSTPATEEDIVCAIANAPTDYVVSKRMLTRFVSSYHHDYTHWHFILPTIYGYGENPNRLIPYVINALKQQSHIKLTSGEQIRQYIHVNEIPRLITLAYEHSLTSGIYNVAGRDILSVKQLVAAIYNHYDIVLPEEIFGHAQRTDTYMKYLALDGQILYTKIAFESELSITDMLSTYEY